VPYEFPHGATLEDAPLANAPIDGVGPKLAEGVVYREHGVLHFHS
jgi:hypothetical protein